MTGISLPTIDHGVDSSLFLLLFTFCYLCCYWKHIEKKKTDMYINSHIKMDVWRSPQYTHRPVLSPKCSHRFSHAHKECNIPLMTVYLGSYCLWSPWENNSRSGMEFMQFVKWSHLYSFYIDIRWAYTMMLYNTIQHYFKLLPYALFQILTSIRIFEHYKTIPVCQFLLVFSPTSHIICNAPTVAIMGYLLQFMKLSLWWVGTDMLWF